jgi:CRISPR system Cascade subunit CasB
MKTQLKTIENEQVIIIPKAFLEECNITQDDVNLRIENGRIIIEPIKSKKDRTENFVNYVMDFCRKKNKGALAALKGADNANKQAKSFHYLAEFYIDVESEMQWLPYATIAAVIAQANVEKNGNVGIGRAIARCYGTSTTGEKKEIDTQAVSKLRRLLACDSTTEVCRILRPLFSLIDAKGLAHSIDYVQLLRDLEGFNIDWRREQARQHWARDFYKRLAEKDIQDE